MGVGFGLSRVQEGRSDGVEAEGIHNVLAELGFVNDDRSMEDWFHKQ